MTTSSPFATTVATSSSCSSSLSISARASSQQSACERAPRPAQGQSNGGSSPCSSSCCDRSLQIPSRGCAEWGVGGGRRLTSAAPRRFFAISSTTCAQVTLACAFGRRGGGVRVFWQPPPHTPGRALNTMVRAGSACSCPLFVFLHTQGFFGSSRVFANLPFSLRGAADAARFTAVHPDGPDGRGAVYGDGILG